MPSSTSSSEPVLERPVPARRWGALLAIAAALTALLATGWELALRRAGFGPSIDDSPDLWAEARRRLDADPRAIVLVGASRTLYDLDLDVLEAALGARPIQLATVGTNGLVVLEHLAADPDFAGTAIVGVVEGLFFLPPGIAERRAREGIARFEEGSWAQRWSHALWLPLDRRLTFLEAEQFRLGRLIEQLRLPQRAGVVWEFLPYHAVHDEERRARLWPRVETDAALRYHIRAVWMTPPPLPFGPEVMRALGESGRQIALGRARGAVAKIRARGGKVVFVRHPSSGDVLAQERQRFPRARYWAPLLALTGAPGIHFEDHPDLVFECPEWSHLSDADATAYSRALAPRLQVLLRSL